MGQCLFYYYNCLNMLELSIYTCSPQTRIMNFHLSFLAGSSDWQGAVIARVHALIGWESQVDKSRLWEKRRISDSLPSLSSFSNSGLIFTVFTLTNSRWCRKAQRNGWSRERAGGNKAWVTPGKLSPYVLAFLSLAPELGVENISDTLQNREASLSLYLPSTICLCQQLYMYLERS